MSRNKISENAKCKNPCKYTLELIVFSAPNINAEFQLAAGVVNAAFIAMINPKNMTNGFPPICTHTEELTTEQIPQSKPDYAQSA